MNINISSDGSDDISVITPLTGVPSPAKNGERKQIKQRLAAPQILDDDEDSKELTVYEDENGEGWGEHGGGYKAAGGGRTSPVNVNLAPSNLTPLFNRSNTDKQTSNNTKTKSISFKSNEANLLRKDSTTTKLINQKKSWLTSTTYFQRAIDSSFDTIDVDSSGDVTLEELYAGLLLIHLKMAKYVGSAACRVRSVSLFCVWSVFV